jgi:hypothetical protein
MRTLMVALVGMVATLAGGGSVVMLYRAYKLLESASAEETIILAIPILGVMLAVLLVIICLLLMCLVWAVLMAVADTTEE